ncbi:cytochrome c family protein [Thermohalobaculum xanthum]|nr:c-type cytochrome [Thermohalobaculum xanthum]
MRRLAPLLAAMLSTALLGASQTDADAETPLERGAYLVGAVAACGNCHSPLGPDGVPVPDQELAGRFVIKLPEFDAWAPNITPASRVASWSDAELARAIREGIRPDGSVIGPPMPIELYRGIADEDLMAIVAYLRTLPPVENEVPRSTYNIPLPPSYGPPVVHIERPSEDDPVAYGAYLAGPVAHCTECHTPMIGGHFDFENSMGAGGREFPGPWGVSVSANLTPAEHALARLSDAEVVDIIRTGQRPDGTRLLPPMGVAFYSEMTERDAQAIVAWLRTLPPKSTP